MKHKLQSILAERNINNLRYADDITFKAESEEELKILMKVKQESGKAGLKLNIQKIKITASSPTSWQIDGETTEIVADFIFLDSKITVDGDCSQKIERHLLLGKAMTDLDSVLKNRKEKRMQRYHVANNGPYSQSYGFSSSHVWM